MRRILGLFDRGERLALAGVLAAVFIMAPLQAIGVGAVVPFLSLVAHPEQLHGDGWLADAFAAAGSGDPNRFLLLAGGVVLVAVVVSNAWAALTRWLMVRVAWSNQRRLSTRLLERYLAQPWVAFRRADPADFERHVLIEIELLTNGVILPLLHLAAYGLSAAFIIALVVWAEPALALLVALLFGAGYTAVYLAGRPPLERLGRERVASSAARFHALRDAFGGLEFSRLRGLERRFVDRYAAAAERYARTSARAQVAATLPRHGIEALALASMLFVLLRLMSTRGGVADALPLAGLYAFAVLRIAPAFQQVYHALVRLRFHHALIGDVARDLAANPGVECGAQAPDPDPDPGGELPFAHSIRLHDVGFTFPDADAPALHGTDLTIRRGERVAFVGATGAGKTTLLGVLLGLLRPTEGALLVDDRPVDDAARRRAWQRRIGYVPQRSYLADDTIARNIAFGLPDAEIDAAAVERAARDAALDDVVARLPDGYATRIGEGGVRLSGGERQRIGIARALYAAPDVLVLDEATSALDRVTDRDVRRRIARADPQRTIVIVAHRMASVRDCDRIHLLAEGRVRASGSYDELFARDAEFRALVEADALADSEAGTRAASSAGRDPALRAASPE